MPSIFANFVFHNQTFAGLAKCRHNYNILPLQDGAMTTVVEKLTSLSPHWVLCKVKAGFVDIFTRL